jgi:hypothetical protein
MAHRSIEETFQAIRPRGRKRVPIGNDLSGSHAKSIADGGISDHTTASRGIGETFQAVKSRGRKGVPDAPAIDIGISASGGGASNGGEPTGSAATASEASGSDLSSSLSQAGQQIAQLQAAYAQQVALITANTQAIQRNTSAQGNRSGGDTAGKIASGLFGGLGLLAPLISGIAGLFGGHSTPAALPVYTPPAPIAIDATLREGTASGSQKVVNTSSTANGAALASTAAQAATHVTVNVSAMDSQSFMDRSADIASAVREAMLNLHPINDVVANL